MCVALFGVNINLGLVTMQNSVLYDALLHGKRKMPIMTNDTDKYFTEEWDQ